MFSIPALGAMSGVLSTGMTVASAALGVLGAISDVKQQNEAYTNNIQMSNEAASKENNLMLQGYRAQGTAIASSQNEGISTDLVANDLARQIGQEITINDANRKLQERQTQRNMEGVHANWQSRINSVAPGDNSKILAAAISGVGKIADHSLTLGKNDNKYVSTPMGQGYRMNIDTAKKIGWRPGR